MRGGLPEVTSSGGWGDYGSTRTTHPRPEGRKHLQTPDDIPVRTRDGTGTLSQRLYRVTAMDDLQTIGAYLFACL